MNLFVGTRWKSGNGEKGARGLVPESLLKYSFANGILVPHFLKENDYPWLGFLIQEYDRFVGRRRWELNERWKEPLPFSSLPEKKDLAIHVLNQNSKDRLKSAISPVKARMTLFRNACGTTVFSPSGKNETLRQSAMDLNISVSELEDSLFADLPEEKQVLPLEGGTLCGKTRAPMQFITRTRDCVQSNRC